MEGIGGFYLGLANHIKILQAPELEQYVVAFAKENLISAICEDTIKQSLNFQQILLQLPCQLFTF